MRNAKLVVTLSLCLASGHFYISINSSYVENNNECFGAWPKHNS